MAGNGELADDGAAFQYLLIGDFGKLDAIVQPVLSVGDHSLEFQIAVAPPFPGRLDVQVAQLVSHPSPGGGSNEYNINGLTPSECVQLYDAFVPAMLAVDPTLKFSALELSDYD